VCESSVLTEPMHALFIPIFSFSLPPLSYRLVNSSVIEAAETIEKLSLREDKNSKLALFSLHKFIKVSEM